MPWIPEHFSAKFLSDLRMKQRTATINAVPYFDGVLSGHIDPLIDSFVGEPELHHPVRGRVKGAAPFARFITETNDALRAANVDVTAVDLIVTPSRTVEEVVLSFDTARGRVELPIAIVTDRTDGGLQEMRLYFSTWPLTGAHANRPPLLQPDSAVRDPDIVGDYQRALAAGDVDATVATFEPDATVREPAGGSYVHTGTDQLRELYGLFFSNGGGIPLEHCTSTDDGRACALEYNVIQWGVTALPPEAGVAVYVRGESGKIAAARIYDDSNPPIGH